MGNDKEGTAATERPTASKNGGWMHFHAKLNHAADNFWYCVGKWVATHAKTTVAISLFFVIICCFGFANFRTETDGEDLWVPANSISKEHEDIVLEYFDDASDFAAILMETPDGSNIITKETFDVLWELDAKIKALTTDSGYSYADLCTTVLNSDECDEARRGATRFWGNDFDVYEASVTNDAELLESINIDVFPDGQAVSFEAVFGNSATFDDSGAIVSAVAMTQSYSMRQSDGLEDEVSDWQADYQDLLDEEADTYSAILNVKYLTGRSIDDALAESITGEIYLFVATYVLMVIFVMIVIGRCRAGSVRRRSWLGLGGIGFVMAAGLAAYGVNSGFGVPFTSLSQILPFILIGIGVDDMFVIVASLDHTDENLPVEERIALALKRCGVSVTYTSLTNFFAFMLGSTSSLPAVRGFCLYAGTAILFDFVLQMTAFVALVTMDLNRQAAGKMDWCCCCTNKTFLEEERVKRGVNIRVIGDGESRNADDNGYALRAADAGKAASSAVIVHELSAVGRWMRYTYTPFILSAKGKALVILGSLGILAAGIHGVTQATQGFDVLDLAPDDHYSRDFTELARVYELELDTQFIPMGVYTQDVDYPSDAVQAQIQATDDLMLDQRFLSGPLDSWLSSFIAWAANGTEYSANVGTSGGYPVYQDRATFYEALSVFTAEEANSRFLRDIVYSTEDSSVIEISRSLTFLIDLTTTDNNIDALQDARDVVDLSTLDPKPFEFSPVFIFTEQFLVMYQELILNFVLALVAVAVLSLFILGNITIVVLVCVTVAIIDLELLGFVYHWGLEVNSITVIELIMAVGLVVDYTVHIVHYFLHQDPSISKDTRIAGSLGEIGPSVILGASTTFVGILPMLFANNVIFRVFFKMFLIIITFGFFHGVVFIPVALSLLPEKAVAMKHVQDGEATAADKDSHIPVTVHG